MHLEIDLSDEEYRDLISSRARGYDLAARVLGEVGQRAWRTEDGREVGPVVELSGDDDRMPTPYQVPAIMWATEFSPRLRVFPSGDLIDEGDQCDEVERALEQESWKHPSLRYDDLEDGDDLVDPHQVVSGVRNLATSSEVARVADMRDARRVTVDFDPDAMTQGASGIRDMQVEREADLRQEEAAARRSDSPAAVDLYAIDKMFEESASNGMADSHARNEAVDAAVETAAARRSGSDPHARSGRPTRRDRARAAQRWEQNREYAEDRLESRERKH